ncbi:hypothetical protein [Paenibacillus naphthalenovorans]|nr:hypothetical protein [Paenibacillus naphthalenovorans]
MLENMINQLSDEDLEKCFLEIVEWRESGVLQMYSIIRKQWEEFKQKSGIDTFPIHMMSEPILFEIAKRKYREEGINV